MSTCNSLSRLSIRTARPSLIPGTQLRPANLPQTQCRYESTTRRHKKLLHVPEAPSYTSTRPTPTLVFNPPSSAPSVYHTPAKFLPRDDKRWMLYRQALALSTSAASSASASTPTSTSTSAIARPGTPLYTTSHSAPTSTPPANKPTTLPLPVRQPYPKKYHVTPAAIAEIQRLRASDPDTWTRVRLAERFGCSQFFVGMVAKNAGKAERVREEQDRVRRRWGAVRRGAREDRGRRREGWGRD